MAERLRVVTIIGNRPQLMKAAPFSAALKGRAKEIIIHTGQHYDWRMSGSFFHELRIPKPKYNLGIGSGSQAEQTGKMLIALEPVLIKEHPDMVVVFGDTNSTVAGALAAAKLHIPLAHIEAGMRSFDRLMPEEMNRVITDHLSDLLFCPSPVAVANLRKEGIRRNVWLVGDNMLDSLFATLKRARRHRSLLARYHLTSKHYILLTLHRAGNTDDRVPLTRVLQALAKIDEPIIFPIHPRTQAAIDRFHLTKQLRRLENVLVVPPLGYLDMVTLLKHARLVMTDSGGLQKETFSLRIPCLTLRENTEWVETVSQGWNQLVGTRPAAIVRGVKGMRIPKKHQTVYGRGQASRTIARQIIRYLHSHG